VQARALAQFIVRVARVVSACETRGVAPPPLDFRPLPLSYTLSVLIMCMSERVRFSLVDWGGTMGGWVCEKGWDTGWWRQRCLAHPAWGVSACEHALGRAPVRSEWRAWVGGVADALAASAGVRARAGGFVRKWKFRHAAASQRGGNLTLAGCSVSVSSGCVLVEGYGPALALALPRTHRRGTLTLRSIRTRQRVQALLRAASAPGGDAALRPLLHPLRLLQRAQGGWDIVLELRGRSAHAIVPHCAPRRPGGDCLAALRPAVGGAEATGEWHE
jgi:hypothetical protein